MGVHDALSARIAERSGFRGLWASGLGISSVLGMRDANEASWSQVLAAVESMASATDVPILVDGDSGYGSFNNFRIFVRRLCRLGLAGVCIEDRLFPKENSFSASNHKLAEIDEFCGRIRAGKDSQTSDSFSIVARVEALVAGVGLDEALRRARAYHGAGADAILIHSKRKDPEEILAFARIWDNRCPLLIVPTTFWNTPASVFRTGGISAVIWANQGLRATITAFSETCAHVLAQESVSALEERIASLDELFGLLEYGELRAAERRYNDGSSFRQERRTDEFR
jgi:phosphoenolpyruvate phosphomutase